MNAVMYGAGNIGRGFIGPRLVQSGYQVIFVDISQWLVDEINRQGSYPVRTVDSDHYEERQISGVTALSGANTAAVAAAIAQTDLLALSVGAGALEAVSATIAAGIKQRFALSCQPLDILICENLMDADKVLGRLLKAHLSPTEQALFDQRIGLVQTAIGKMVPLQTAEMQQGNPLRVAAERYDFLPVDGVAFRGPLPPIVRMVPCSPFDFYVKRKLYLHNMGHAVCGYLGLYTGYRYIHQAIDDPHIYLLVREAMGESMVALSREYQVSLEEMLPHVEDLLLRFTNRALQDTCQRVGRDARRKLAANDRLLGAALLCQAHGTSSVAICVGAAGALYHYLQEAELLQSVANATEALERVAELDADSSLSEKIIYFYERYQSGTSPKQLCQMTREKRRQRLVEIV